ncbi:DivIVA domain-containing protein [Cellulomonas endophytica]|uniref:DivIVA domain-containing protein n=1 Tax=Cellulomonas endophytica TaxID=2494735 RepID=UPI001011BDC2|nr:DivIVA domain-containing protein [Cellulomonas endophytica]
MALLTADDVLNKKFQATKFREGYDQDEVDDFLDEVVNTLRELQGENEDLKSRLAAAGGEERAEAAPAPVVTAPEPEPVVVEAAPEPTPEPAPVAAAAAPTPAPRSNDTESAAGMLALAQKLHDEYVRNGQEESERLLGEARAQATRIVREAEETSARTLGQLEQERTLLERKIDELRVFERDYRQRLKSYLDQLLGDLDNRANALPARSGQPENAGL